ncbi:MAG: iron-sulfur cluster repair di-iron protein [Candidatus Izimaplasma sp.]|nr:iron-sulfur cluster repair di-iron protein [Candidatus Izimaplasma bacterium]
MTFNQEQSIGNIVSKFPKAADIFQSLNIDYCCGGDRSLITACNEVDLDINEVLTQLNDYYNSLRTSAKDYTTVPLNALINIILQNHHAYLYERLPLISKLTTKILRVHGNHHKELTDVFKVFHQLKTEMDMHLIKEETTQYPAIENYLKSNNKNDLETAVKIINELKNDHSEVGDALKKLRDITDDYVIPEDVCEMFVKTYEYLEDLEQNTFTHIHLENNVLFKRLIALYETSA